MTSNLGRCGIVELPRIENRSGSITPVESGKDVPFKLERVYFLYDVPSGAVRGGHAHRNLRQLIVAPSGAFDVILSDGTESRRFTMNRPYLGLLVYPGIWRELENFSSGAICMVLASMKYDEADYIRNHEEYLEYVRL